MNSVAHITEANYLQFLRQHEFAVILWDADWDVASHQKFWRVFEQAARQFGTRVSFGEVDIEKTTDLVSSISILNVPAISYYRNGQVVKVLIGAERDLTPRIQALLHGLSIEREPIPREPFLRWCLRELLKVPRFPWFA